MTMKIEEGKTTIVDVKDHLKRKLRAKSDKELLEDFVENIINSTVDYIDGKLSNAKQVVKWLTFIGLPVALALGFLLGWWLM